MAIIISALDNQTAVTTIINAVIKYSILHIMMYNLLVVLGKNCGILLKYSCMWRIGCDGCVGQWRWWTLVNALWPDLLLSIYHALLMHVNAIIKWFSRYAHPLASSLFWKAVILIIMDSLHCNWPVRYEMIAGACAVAKAARMAVIRPCHVVCACSFVWRS